MACRKRKMLNLEQRIDVIKQHDKGVSCRALAQTLNVGKTQIQKIISDRALIMKMWQSGVNCESRVVKLRKTVNHELNNIMYEVTQLSLSLAKRGLAW